MKNKCDKDDASFKSEKNIDQLLYVITHYVREPITTLFSLLDQINLDEIGASNFKTFFNKTAERVGYSLLLLDKAYYWSLLELEHLELKRNSETVEDLIFECINKCKRAADFKNISVNFHTSCIYSIKCDKNLTALIIQNMIASAIRSSKAHGSIDIRLVSSKASMKLIIINSDSTDQFFFQNSFSGLNNGKLMTDRKTNEWESDLHLSKILAEKMNYRLLSEKKNSCLKFCLEIPYEY